MANRQNIVIIGGGTAGITVAARVLKAIKTADVTIIEPSDKHYYQSFWTLAGAGMMKKERTVKDEAPYMPKKVNWVKEYAADIDPDKNIVVLKSGKNVSYDYLVVAPGIQLDWDKIKGLKETMGKNGVGSNYSYETVDYTWKALQEFEGGNAIFTNPLGQVKCGGAPQKIMYLSERYIDKKGLRDKSKIIGAFAGTMMLGVPEINKVLNRIVDERKIDMRFYHNLVEVRGDEKIAVFDVRDAKTGEHIKQEEIEFNFLHVTPPQSSPDFIKTTKIAVAEGPHQGFVEADPKTMQHPKYKNVFSLGDASALPTAKTAAAIRKQAPVLVQNLKDVVEGKAPSKAYKGYSACAIITQPKKVVFAEFLYGNEFKPTFPFDQAKERFDMYLMKRFMLPFMYWNFMLKGLA